MEGAFLVACLAEGRYSVYEAVEGTGAGGSSLKLKFSRKITPKV